MDLMKRYLFDKILNRLKALASGPDFDVKLNVEPVIIAQKVNRNL